MTTGENQASYPLVNEWKTWQYAKSLSARTVTERTATVCRMAEWSGKAPQSVTPDDIVTWLAEGGDWSPNSRWTYHTTLTAWFLWLQKVGHRVDNPMVNVDRPRRTKGEPHPVSNRDLLRLLGVRAHKRTKAMILLAAFQGLRVHEIAKIKGEHFDLVERTLTVQGKGGRVDVMPLHYRVLQLAVDMPRRGHWFPGSDRGHQRRESVGTTIKEAMTRAGVPGSAHALRHWFGTALTESGVDLRIVQTLMRHQSLATTEIYTRVSDKRKAAAIDRVDPFALAQMDAAA